MTFQFNNLTGILPLGIGQGSCAQFARAEKAASSVRCSVKTTRLANSSNLQLLRLDGCNPHGYRLRQPPNLANLHAHPCTTRTHAYTCASAPAWGFYFSRKLKNRLGRLGGWQTKHPCGFQPSNLLSNLFEVGQIAGQTNNQQGPTRESVFMGVGISGWWLAGSMTN